MMHMFDEVLQVLEAKIREVKDRIIALDREAEEAQAQGLISLADCYREGRIRHYTALDRLQEVRRELIKKYGTTEERLEK